MGMSEGDCQDPHGDGRLTPRVINTVWNQARDFAGVDKDKTPNSVRHGMGVFIMEKTGNVAAVQRQLVSESNKVLGVLPLDPQ